MPRKKSAEPPAQCHHCGGPVSRAGRAPADGIRFCTKYEECRKAQNAHYYKIRVRQHKGQAVVNAPKRMGPEACSGCGIAMKPRKWRSGDELGRFCARVDCSGKRDRAREEAWGGDKPELISRVKQAEIDMKFLGEVIMADAEDYIHEARKTCPDCGLTSAVSGWAHPNRQFGPCFGTLDGAPVTRLSEAALSHAWPFKREYEEVVP